MKAPILLIAALSLIAAGCSQGVANAPADGAPATTTASTATTASKANAGTEAPAVQPTPATEDTTNVNTAQEPKEGEEVAVLETSQGRIVIRFLEDKAPNHVANFKKLAKEGFYDGTRFHRVIPGFMIQGGDPNSRGTDRSVMGTGGSGTNVNAEFSDVRHERGIVSMARSSNPNSASSQFFIMVEEKNHLDGQYSAFGRVVSGLEAVDKIVDLPRDARDNPNDMSANVLKSVKIVKWPIKD